MLKHIFKTGSRILVCASIVSGFILSSCDSFENDSISKDKEVTVDDREFFSLPNASTVIDLKSLVRSYSDVTLTVTHQPEKGNLSKIGESVFKYQPNSDFKQGRDFFGIEISKDGKSLLTDNIFINVDSDTTQFPCRLFAVPDSVMIPVGSVDAIIKILQNDRICLAEGQEVSVSIYTGPLHGTAEVIQQSDSSWIEYTPHAGYKGRDQLIYKISVASSDTSSVSYGIVNIHIGNPDCAIRAFDDYKFLSDSVSTDSLRARFYFIPVLSNDTLCGQLSSLNVVAPPRYGEAEVRHDTIVYRANAAPRSDSLKYRVCNTVGACSEAYVYIKPR